MASFYEFFNEQKYGDAVKNVSVWVLPHGTVVALGQGHTLWGPSRELLPPPASCYRCNPSAHTETPNTPCPHTCPRHT